MLTLGACDEGGAGGVEVGLGARACCGGRRRGRAEVMSLEATSVFPQRGRDDATQRRYVFPLDMKPRLLNQ